MPSSSAALLSVALLAGTALAQVAVYGQCGGSGYTGATVCTSGSCCSTQNEWYAQCTPGTACPAATGTTLTTSSKTTSASATATATTTSVKSTSTATSTTTSASSTSTGQTRFAGINIAGFDFGCTTDGTCVLSEVYGPVESMPPYYDNPDGAGQMDHFYNDDNLNIFRLPVGWQYLTGGTLGGTLNSTNLGWYDDLVQSCLSLSSAYCIVDIHNYARWDGSIIGQSSGAVTDDEFVSLWTQVATYYKNEPRVWFGTMNEPHDLSSVTTWAATVQAVVTAIREAGATSQYISLPGTDYQAASEVIDDGSAAALLTVTNPNGTTDGLIFDVHKYLDSDNSGTSSECVTNNIDDAFEPLATWLREQGRQAILTETGGGNTASCETYLCEQIAYLNENADVYLGYLGWGAGSFETSYTLSETPTESNGVWTDQALVAACISRA